MKVSEYVSQSARPKFTEALVVNRSSLILPDTEFPYHNAKFINKCIKLALSWGIQDLVLAGDGLHWSAFSFFFGKKMSVDDESIEAESAIAEIVHPFRKVYWILGNHDMRGQRLMNVPVSNERMMRLVIRPDIAEEVKDKVTFSDYFHLSVGTGENRWLVIHPKATNTVPANAAKVIAVANNCHCAMAHNHLIGMQQTPDGRHFGVEIGCCVDPERLDYYMERHTTRPKMRNGALILRKVDDKFIPTLLTPDWTDWDLLEGANAKTKAGKRCDKRPTRVASKTK